MKLREMFRSGKGIPPWLDKSHEAQFALIKRWRTGFVQSIGVAQRFIEVAKEAGHTLSDVDLKHMLFNWFNPKERPKAISKAASKIYDSVSSVFSGLSSKQKRGWIFECGKKGLIVLAVWEGFSYANSGYAGEGRGIGAGQGGATGAALNTIDGVARDMTQWWIAEDYVIPFVKDGFDVIGDSLGEITWGDRLRKAAVIDPSSEPAGTTAPAGVKPFSARRPIK